jgi:AraC-like DNA-binding protein
MSGYELVQEQIRKRIERHGSLRAAARVLGVSAPYLCRLFKGEKREGSDALLRKLGIRREVTFSLVQKTKHMSSQDAAAYHGDIDGDSNY